MADNSYWNSFLDYAIEYTISVQKGWERNTDNYVKDINLTNDLEDNMIYRIIQNMAHTLNLIGNTAAEPLVSGYVVRQTIDGLNSSEVNQAMKDFENTYPNTYHSLEKVASEMDADIDAFNQSMNKLKDEDPEAYHNAKAVIDIVLTVFPELKISGKVANKTVDVYSEVKSVYTNEERIEAYVPQETNLHSSQSDQGQQQR